MTTAFSTAVGAGWTTFYGKWILRSTEIDDHDGYLSAFIIRWSDGSDATYYPRSGQPPLEIEVSGDQWQVQLLLLGYGIAGWHVAPAVRTTEFDQTDGVLVNLDSRTHSHAGAHHPGMRLHCKLDDPSVLPPDPGGPFDFTVPEEQSAAGYGGEG
jgi:hypothetical protein